MSEDREEKTASVEQQDQVVPVDRELLLQNRKFWRTLALVLLALFSVTAGFAYWSYTQTAALNKQVAAQAQETEKLQQAVGALQQEKQQLQDEKDKLAEDKRQLEELVFAAGYAKIKEGAKLGFPARTGNEKPMFDIDAGAVKPEE